MVGFYFMSFDTGKCIHVYHWKDVFPISDILIERAE